MQISIGLPSLSPGASGRFILDWARKADESFFESLATLDVIPSPSYDPLVALTGAAAVTSRIRLMTSILVAPLRNPVLLAKQAASLDVLSNGRLSLGLAAGYREQDFRAVEVDIHQRGKIFDKQLETMSRIWSGERIADDIEPVGPVPVQPGGPRLLLGGGTPAALQRLGRWGEGYIDPGSPAEIARNNYALAETAWKEAGRSGKPHFISLAYYALGPNGKERGAEFLHIYYAQFPEVEQYFRGVMCTTTETVKNTVKAYEEAGVDELAFLPLIGELDQIDRLVEALA